MEMTREYLTRKANEIRDAFIETQKDPIGFVVSIAKADGLNGEQVRRLCEAANVSIKRYLTFELKDPQATFPVVDWRMAMDHLGLPQASFGYVDIDDDSELKAAGMDVVDDIMKAASSNLNMQKQAASCASTLSRKDQLHKLSVLKQARAQLMTKECELGCEADKSITAVWNLLRDDAVKTGSINEAYTIALDRVGMRYEMPDAIDALFNKMHKSISHGVTSKLAALEVTPVIGAINPDWDLIHHLTTYVAANQARSKVSEMIKSAESKIDGILVDLFRE